MNEVEMLAAEIRRAASGDPWYGPSVIAVLSGVGAREAGTAVPGASHSIWEVVSHVTFWADYAAYRVAGGAPREVGSEEWPAVERADDGAWSESLHALVAAHERLAEALLPLSLEALDAVGADTPRDAGGEPVTLRRVVSGVAQHTAYHAGQLAVLKQLLSSGPTHG